MGNNVPGALIDKARADGGTRFAVFANLEVVSE
jgi:hypothetical protein